jgi:hypothetical protein
MDAGNALLSHALATGLHQMIDYDGTYVVATRFSPAMLVPREAKEWWGACLADHTAQGPTSVLVSFALSQLDGEVFLNLSRTSRSSNEAILWPGAGKWVTWDRTGLSRHATIEIAQSSPHISIFGLNEGSCEHQ